VLSQDEVIKIKIQKVGWNDTSSKCMDADVSSLQRLKQEIRVWHQLRHRNVVQLYGTVSKVIGAITERPNGLMT
jgi:hypothetical protein